MARPLTEAQAWEVVEQVFRRQTGLCLAVRNLWWSDLITRKVRDRMEARLERLRKRLRRQRGGPVSGYWWPRGIARSERDDNRANAAERFARAARRRK